MDNQNNRPNEPGGVYNPQGQRNNQPGRVYNPQGQRPPQQGGYYHPQGQRPPQQGGYYHPQGQRPPQQGGYYNPQGQRPPQQGGYYHPQGQRPPQQGGYYHPQGQAPNQQGGYYHPQGQAPNQQGGYYHPQGQAPNQQGGYYPPQSQTPNQPNGYSNSRPQPMGSNNPEQQNIKPEAKPEVKSEAKPDKKAAKKQAKAEKENKKGKGKKKGVVAFISVFLVFAIVAGIVAVVLNAIKYDKKNHSIVQTGAVADVTFKDDVIIISDTDKVQDNFQKVTLVGDQYTLTYSRALPDELAVLTEGDTFCVPSIQGADANCFEMGFCGEVVSIETSSITFKVPSMEKVFSDFNFQLQGDLADSAEFVPAAGVSVITNTPITKSNFQTLNATTLSAAPTKKELDDYKVRIGDYTIAPTYSYVGPSKQSILPDYSMFCDSLELGVSVTNRVGSNESKAISGKISLEDLATKANIKWHEDDYGNIVVEEFDVGFIANAKSKLTYKDTFSVGLDDLPKNTANDIPSKIESIVQIEDVTDTEKGKLILGSYVLGYNVELPGLVNADNKIGYLSAGIVIQFFISASGELSAECTLSNSGFYRAEFDLENGFSGEAKGYDYPSPALYTGEFNQELLDSKPVTTVEFKGQLKLNAATGIDIGVCILGMVPMKISNNLAEVEIIFSGSGKKQIVDISDAEDKNLLFTTAESVMAKSNSTLKIHLGAKIKMPVSFTLASFGVELVLYDYVWFQYPEAIEFDSSQCGFGDIFVGEAYCEEEMDQIFKNFEKEHNIDSILTDLKDGASNAVLDTFKSELAFFMSELEVDLEDEDIGSVKYYSSGAMYLLDADGTVMMSIITGDKICNAGGLTVGTSPDNAEKIYSAPDDEATIDLNLSEIALYMTELFGWDLGDFEDQHLTMYLYVAEKTGEEMILLYSDDALKAIIVQE